jgi:hypothetical protein
VGVWSWMCLNSRDLVFFLKAFLCEHNPCVWSKMPQELVDSILFLFVSFLDEIFYNRVMGEQVRNPCNKK